METERKSKIKSCRFVSEWAGPNGIVFYHELELENNDKGQIGTKEKNPDKIQVGQELTYTIESTTRGNKIKAVSSGQGSGGFKAGRQQQEPKIQFIGFAARYTIDYLIANKSLTNVSLSHEFDKTFDVIYNKMISKL